MTSYAALFSSTQSSSGIEYAAVRPWFAPVTPNTLLLDGSYEEIAGRPVNWDRALTSTELIASTGTSGPFDDSSSLAVLELEQYSLDCGTNQFVHIPKGEGVAWLIVTVDGSAQLIMRPDLVAVPSETRSLYWRPPAGTNSRPPETLTCIGDGVLHIDFAAESSEPPSSTP